MSKTKELTTTDKSSPWTQAQVDLIKATVAKGATNDELKLFLYTAARTGLDPLTKQIHFVKRKESITIQTGIDGYRAIAERTKELAGIDDAVFDSEDNPQPKKATVTVYRIVNGQRMAFSASARWTEYFPKPPNDFMWKKMPYLMLAKCAEALALRKAFPNDLSGLYTNEEMQQADKPDEVINYETPSDQYSNIAVECEVVDQQPKEENRRSIVCPYCGNSHTGKYPKCIDCWKREKNGEKLVKQETKTLINDNEKPF